MIQLEQLTKKFESDDISKDHGSSRVMCLAAKDCDNEKGYKCFCSRIKVCKRSVPDRREGETNLQTNLQTLLINLRALSV